MRGHFIGYITYNTYNVPISLYILHIDKINENKMIYTVLKLLRIYTFIGKAYI